MKILALDDDRAFLDELKVALSERYEFEGLLSASDFFARIESHPPDVVLLDMHMPEISGLQVLRLLRSKRPELPVVMLTGDSNPDSVVKALHFGASDYVLKGREDLLIGLQVRLTRIESERSLQKQNVILASTLAEARKSYEILGISQSVLKQRLEIQRLKGSKISVLIEGENGTGKELVARNLNLQEKIGRPFVALNCGAIPHHLFESELFGHVKGSFTGAVSDQRGKVLAADSGDLFLDEIGEMPLSMQVKLLRVLEEKAVTPVGSTKTIPVQIRIISATNQNLERLVSEGKFRQDLFFRINQVMIRTTPLRERRDDILFLAKLFVERAKPGMRISNEASAKLVEHHWPGNIRELQNTIERACLFARDSFEIRDAVEIEPDHLGLSTLNLPTESGVPCELFPTRPDEITRARFDACVDWAQRRFIEAALGILKENDGVISRLEMSRSYFYRRKKELGLNSGVQ